MYKQTICFIRNDDKILMLNRDFAPTQGLWNGVGGKMEENETPLECVIREVKEETSIDISSTSINYKGTVSWEVDDKYIGGMYVFLVEIPNTFVFQTPRRVAEGILDWKKISWLLDDHNFGVGEMIPHFLPHILNNPLCLDHKCVLHKKRLTRYECSEVFN
ncbi:NUDIX hydrolase [Metabacillus indicus]|uniref:NUDIX hydrolase n=1 Tax=Metabacillus indicus TaxID=246786 RepID=UPI0004DD1915|nr:8-oxo-dGTP diphosphatase [Metabacillus indicus]KEZ51322.1 DNA mismatch repair protein MutT [Metabacillus indicus LMG 22858]